MYTVLNLPNSAMVCQVLDVSQDSIEDFLYHSADEGSLLARTATPPTSAWKRSAMAWSCVTTRWANSGRPIRSRTSGAAWTGS